MKSKVFKILIALVSVGILIGIGFQVFTAFYDPYESVTVKQGKNKKKVELDNKNKLFDKTIIKEMFTNKGILVYSLITMTMIVLKNVL